MMLRKCWPRLVKGKRLTVAPKRHIIKFLHLRIGIRYAEAYRKLYPVPQTLFSMVELKCISVFRTRDYVPYLAIVDGLLHNYKKRKEEERRGEERRGEERRGEERRGEERAEQSIDRS
jgi:hypothetical protein